MQPQVYSQGCHRGRRGVFAGVSGVRGLFAGVSSQGCARCHGHKAHGRWSPHVKTRSGTSPRRSRQGYPTAPHHLHPVELLHWGCPPKPDLRTSTHDMLSGRRGVFAEVSSQGYLRRGVFAVVSSRSQGCLRRGVFKFRFVLKEQCLPKIRWHRKDVKGSR